MESTIVIKVQYGTMLRRFNAVVNYNEELELSMEALKGKIHGLFGFAPDTEMTLTYIDVDGDVVTLVDDDDLADIMRQCLNPVRITVTVNNDKGTGRSYVRSSGSSTPVRSPKVQLPLPIISNGIEEVLKSVPEPIRDAVTKLSLKLTNKAVSTAPVIADLAETLAKMSLINLSSQSQAGKEMNSQKESSDINKDLPAAGDFQPKNYPVPDLNKAPAAATNVPVNSCNNETVKGNSSDHEQSRSTAIGLAQKGWPCGSSSAPSVTLDPLNECPFSSTFVRNGAAASPATLNHFHPSFRRSHSHGGHGGPIFHAGVQCNGCGVHPIVGPRFKSKVKYDYDLCDICFSKMGKEADYVRIDRPVSYRRKQFKGLDHHSPRSRPHPHISVCPFTNGPLKPVQLGLDSRFVLDVNVIDGTLVAPSTPFTKIWRMCNNGTLVWPRGTQLVWIGGAKLNETVSVEIETPADGIAVDEEVDIAVDFFAPEHPGRYISYWMMASPSGQRFGQRVWVLIQVDDSVKDAQCENIIGLNLNMPPERNGAKRVVIDVNVEPLMDSTPESCNPIAVGNVVSQPLEAIVNEQIKKDDGHVPPPSGAILEVVRSPIDQEHAFPINDSLLVGDGITMPSLPPWLTSEDHWRRAVPVSVSPSVTYPSLSEGVPKSAALPVPPSVTYPSVDVDSPGLGEVAQSSFESSPGVEIPASSPGTAENNVEESLLKELQAMGFNQVELNKEILRMNENNLERALDDLCGVSEWDPLLVELVEMGFHDKEVNRKLLAKNNGSIKDVVMDLIAGEKS